MNRLLSVGDQVKSGTYRFHSRFNRAANFERRGRLVSVVDEQIGPGPLNIVLIGPVLHFRPEGAPVGTLPPLRVTTSSVVFAGCRFAFGPRKRYRSALDVRPGGLRRLHLNLPVLRELLAARASSKSLAFLLDEKRLENFRSGFEKAFANRIRRGAHRVFHGRLLEGIRILKGCGVGLTPSGDDFIAGLLIGLNLLQHLGGQALQPAADAVFAAAKGDNIYSNTFLDMARRGLLFGRMKDLLVALMAGSRTSVRKAGVKLLAIGATSGADLATGFLLTVTTGEGGIAPTRISAPCG